MSAWNLVWMLFSFARTMVTLAAFLVVLARLHWLAMLVVALTTAPQMIASSYFARRHWKIRTDLAEESRLRFYLSGLMTQRDPAKEIRIFALADYFLERFRFYWRNFFRREIGLANRREAVNFFLGALSSLGAVGVWIYIAWRAVARTITIGDVVLYTQAASSCQGNLVELFTQGGQFYEQSLFLGNLFALFDLHPAELEGALRGPEGSGGHSGSRPIPVPLRQGIEFKNVSFRYPGSDKWVLRNVSFHLPPDHSVALVGRNGAGKTTLVKLLVRLYDPTEGEILLDGHSLRDYDLASLRRLFAVIFQDYTRYWLTLRENVGFGDVPRVEDLAQVQQAAEKAGAQEIAERLPSAYETYLARQFMGLGEDLSGGEWQKVALARAYMRDSPILVLDEPTAALDAFAEFELYQSFDKMTAGRLAVFISHRFSTVRMAKHILVLEQGELVEEGSHDELLGRGGLYASMFRTQADRYRDGPRPGPPLTSNA
jgi:ATP-binding cassette subfamily B protein